MKATIAAFNWDLEVAEAACAEDLTEEETSSRAPSSTSQRNCKHNEEDDQLLQSLQKSGELLKGLIQP